MRKAPLCGLLAGALCASIASSAAKSPFTFDAMMKIARIDEPQLSPGGKMVAFTVTTVDMAANPKPMQIYIVPVESLPGSRRVMFLP